MFDLVINHTSTQSDWFHEFLHDDRHVTRNTSLLLKRADLSHVVRPRALPLLTRFSTPSGYKSVWTTFSEDQVDLNYKNPDVLLEMIDTLLFYVSQGADLIRLDAIAYLWKEPGTACIHLSQTHSIVQLLRLVLDQIAPWVLLITETNFPHAENVSYFGDGNNEAQMVYNFALPPLVLDALHTGDAGILAEWAKGLTLPSRQVTFFNFLASHDGIGLNPVRGIWMPAAAQTSGSDLPDIGTPASTTLSLIDEYKIGLMIVRSLRDAGEIVEDPEVTEYLQALGMRLASNAHEGAHRFTFFAIKDAGINAFALPGGFIGVNAGLLTATRSEAELAGVLAHEISHVTQRHIARSIQNAGRANLASAAAILAAILIGATTGMPSDAVLGSVTAAQGLAAQSQINFTRTHESEADRVAIGILAAAGFDPVYQMAVMVGERLYDLLRIEGVPAQQENRWIILLGPVTPIMDEDVSEREVRPLFERSLKKIEEMAMKGVPFLLFQPSVFSNPPFPSFTPLENSAIHGRADINKPSVAHRKDRGRAPSFLTGFTKGGSGGLKDLKRAYLSKRLFQFSSLAWRISLEDQEPQVVLEKGASTIFKEKHQIPCLPAGRQAPIPK